jgi:protein SCO1/2
MGPRLLLGWATAIVIWWGFAFWPAGDSTSWLAVAQSACFGSLPGGLPATQGWIMLTLAPLMLLAVIVTVYGVEIRAAWPRLWRTGGWRLAAVVLTVTFSVEAVWAAARVEADVRRRSVSFSATLEGPLPEAYPRTRLPLPELSLVDQHGGSFANDRLRGQPSVVSFVFAHCQTLCPAIVTTIKRAALAPEFTGVRTVLITLDPWRDTPSALPAMAKAFGLSDLASLVSGDPAAVEVALDAFDVARSRDLATGEVAHVPLVVIVDAEGQVAYRFNNPPAEWIVEGVRRLRAGL